MSTPKPRDILYPRSKLISRFEFTGPPHRYPDSGSDMHWHAWGDDNALYVVDDDGHNFGGPWSFCHLLRCTGIPPGHQVEVVSRFPDLRRYSMRRHLYVNGALAVGPRLYVAAYEYDTFDPAAPPMPLTGNRVAWPPPDGFLQLDATSHLGGVASLMYSDDKGATWHNSPVPNAPHFLGPRFAGLSFVGFGPGYTGVPDPLAGYVYAISNDDNWETGNHIFLARAPLHAVLDRDLWQFFAGRDRDNRAAWSPHEQHARPVLSDPGHVGHPTMTFLPGLAGGRFLLAFGSDSVPHSYAHTREMFEQLWHRSRELQIYEGPTPWGPWSLVHYDPNWEGEHLAYLPQIPPCWLAADSLSGTLLFSGDYRAPHLPAPAESFYAFMTRPFRLHLA
jgi:hypothetical protein